MTVDDYGCSEIPSECRRLEVEKLDFSICLGSGLQSVWSTNFFWTRVPARESTLLQVRRKSDDKTVGSLPWSPVLKREKNESQGTADVRIATTGPLQTMQKRPVFVRIVSCNVQSNPRRKQTTGKADNVESRQRGKQWKANKTTWKAMVSKQEKQSTREAIKTTWKANNPTPVDPFITSLPNLFFKLPHQSASVTPAVVVQSVIRGVVVDASCDGYLSSSYQPGSLQSVLGVVRQTRPVSGNPQDGLDARFPGLVQPG